ncbi:DUF4388 domain-containing protein [Geobacter argillaceus]|uniref:Uncharacterized protein DUF4388 n=1 Tax=Geobacter argillaceus TaxID=345631 RepID=A0A562WRZ9_9BACT|nr:DUF4388 domain-containing protein [Geobacter argillaceus]TWJ33097.1 uncharacterized protein DUF4388 [Geobacter argillaceus]
MSFVGDLEHMPIVDVIQLLHSTRKSGILSVKSRKGESRLVFKDGYIVSANHLNNMLRIGNILVERQHVTPEILAAALQEQENAGKDRKPLIITLVQSGRVRESDAYQALEHLIELTVVEILTWKRGTFSLDVAQAHVSDDYRYYPERMNQEINIDTQGVLMDALRIYDEKLRDGTLPEEESYDGDIAPGESWAVTPEKPAITADVLGLDNLDALDKVIPDVFLGVKAYDPAEPHRQALADELQNLPLSEQEKLLSFLVAFSQPLKGSDLVPAVGPALAVILLSRDVLIRHAVMTVCRHEGLFAFTTDEEANIDHIVDQSHARDLLPVLLVDSPERAAEGFSADKIVALWHREKARYPHLSIVQLASPRDHTFALQAVEAGLSVIPRPCSEERKETIATDAIGFMKALQAWLAHAPPHPDQQILRQFAERVRELGTLSTAPDISYALLRFASVMFERAITFVVVKTELIAERGIGINADKSAGPTPPLRFMLPLDQPSVFRETIAGGRFFYGPSSDPLLAKHLYAEIGAPRTAKILLAPIKSLGRVFALTYCDFGTTSGNPVRADLMETLAHQAGIVLDNALYLNKSENRVQSP